jgi:2-polyprenyl-6-methoxyphenol hydroxylase-like FAD-dependent oxidoreductase
MIDLEADVVVVGAGPVGLLAALCAAKNGSSVILLEKESVRPQQSRAIGITPPSMGIFERLGIVNRFLGEGLKVSHAGGYSIDRKLCTVDFSRLKTTYPFVLTIPQDRTESILETEVTAQSNIRFIRGAEVRAFHFVDGLSGITGADVNGREIKARGRYVIGCDGAKSVMRGHAGARFGGSAYPHTFLMADYNDTTGWGNEARLYFTERGSVESFPLPGGYRRFVLRTPSFIKENTSDFLSSEIPRRCGVSVDNVEKRWESAFGVQHYIASLFAAPRLFLCGDAAHIMSPIGGQNMNVGFADAELAARLIAMMRDRKSQPILTAKAFDRYRRKSALNATIRAELMMRMGTSGGTAWNALRNSAMGLALRTPLATVMNEMFTMLSLPNRDLPSCRVHLEKDLRN